MDTIKMYFEVLSKIKNKLKGMKELETQILL
jgi:hypothetical protein